MPDKVEFYLDNQLYKYVESYSLRYDIFSGCAEFQANIDHETEIILGHDEFDPMRFSWNINGQGVMRGLLDSVDKQYGKEDITQSITGRDMCQILTDNDVLVHNLNLSKGTEMGGVIGDYNDMPIDTIVDHFIKNNKYFTANGKKYYLPEFDLNYSEEALKIIRAAGNLKQVRSSYGESCFQFISRLLNGAGLYIYNTPGTDQLLIHALNINGHNYDKFGMISQKNPISLIHKKDDKSNNNVLTGNYKSSVKNYYQFFKIVGESDPDVSIPGLSYLFKNTYIVKCQIVNRKTPVKFFSHFLNHADQSMWNTQKNAIIHNQVFKQLREFCNLKYTVKEHSPFGFDPYYVNSIVRVEDDFLPNSLNNKNYIVCAVEFVGSKAAGRTTTLELCLPIDKNDIVEVT
jgi:hypothetical protein